MMKFAIVLAALTATAAHADGFNCQTEAGDLVIKAYNNTQAAEGTRNAAVMIFSDPSVGAGKKTIARFSDANETVRNVGATYEAKVDLRFNDSSLGGRNIGGTKLRFIDTLTLEVAFNYNHPIASGESVEGTLTVLKRNGEELSHAVECTRYLKN